VLSIGELAIIVIFFEFGRSYRSELIEYCPPLRGEEAENLVIVLFKEYNIRNKWFLLKIGSNLWCATKIIPATEAALGLAPPTTSGTYKLPSYLKS